MFSLEGGKKPLTSSVSTRLGPALGVTASELQLAERVAGLQRMAVKGALAPQQLLGAVLELSYALPDGEVADDLIDACGGTPRASSSRRWTPTKRSTTPR